DHPNIVAIYDRGFDQGRHYLVLEYVEGRDLHDRVRLNGPLEPNEAVRFIREVAEGLRYASSQGMIHRDVKPANLLMTPEGHAKIIDLGLALQTDDEDERVTRDGTTVGTVDYMAPEQARDSRATSVRSDLYSLGCTFYFLLTGSPPYPGGNVPDKLGRHCTAPVPDVRELRSEVSDDLAALVLKMMAKKPEARFADYMSLIAALDSLPEAKGNSGDAVDALIADDDDEPIAEALIADDDDDIGLAPTGDERGKPARPAPRLPGPPRAPAEPAPAEVSIAMLASLEDAAAPASVRRRGGAPAAPAEDDGVFAIAQSRPTVRRSGGELPLSTWIAAGAVLGLAIALIGFGVLQFLAPTEAGPIVGTPPADEGQGGGGVGAPPVVTARVGRPPDRPLIVPRAAPVAVVPPRPTWAEPADHASPAPVEPAYPADVEAASLPDWSRRPIAVVDGPVVAVRRVPVADDSSDVPSLRAALNNNGGVVEIADNGPFFEDDLLDRAKARTIRARPGFRPMIVVEPSTTALVRDRSAVFALDGDRLVLEGIDLVIDARALPQSLNVLFLLKGAELTLSRCTVTVLNAGTHPFTLVRVDEPTDQRPNRSSLVRIEGSLIRGPAPAVFDMGGSGDLAISRSVILGGSEAIVVHRPTTPRDPRRYFFHRSILASRASVLGLPGGRTSSSPQVRALGSTFAKVAGLDSSGLIHARTDPAGPPSAAIDWLGHDDALVGWPSWLDASERAAKVLVADLAAARGAWKGSDADSREVKRGWPIDDLAVPSALAALAEARPAVLAQVAEPQPSLIEATVGTFTRLPMPAKPRRLATAPGMASRMGDVPRVAGVNASIEPSKARRAPAPANPSAPAAPAAATAPVTGGEVSFDVADPTWRGDLGLFLARRLASGAGHVVVKVTGSGTWPMTPVRLPDGMSLSVEPAATQGQGPTWVALPGVAAPALIELQGGDLALTGINLGWSPSSRAARLVKVEDGHLYLSRCALKSGESPMPAGSGLVLFRAAGTKPLASRPGPLLSPTDRPTCGLDDCLLMAVGGEAVAAELGRGVVSLTNTAILAEGDAAAIALRPQKVARARFEADLHLDHCSIASERALVQVGPWPGAEPGPARPWLVSSSRSAFFEVAGRGRRGSVLLRSLGDGLEHGALTWQADGDGYDLGFFTASGPADHAPSRQRPDVKGQWVDFWCARHVRNVVGPNPRK
ncbi:MAG TPA: serine/threonine-protein kinase, partial [Isosphaeraceae bacterium]